VTLGSPPVAEPSPAPPAPGEDWTERAVDAVDGVVGVVRDKAVAPVTTTARWVVYGLVAAIVGTTALILAAAMAVRLWDAYVPGEVWWGYLVIGGIFVLGGLFLWSKRTQRDRSR
jgi:hypothetical protein